MPLQSHTHVHPAALPAAAVHELAKDPICGTMVDKATAFTPERCGRTDYFCRATVSVPSRTLSVNSSRCVGA